MLLLLSSVPVLSRKWCDVIDGVWVICAQWLLCVVVHWLLLVVQVRVMVRFGIVLFCQGVWLLVLVVWFIVSFSVSCGGVWFCGILFLWLWLGLLRLGWGL